MRGLIQGLLGKYGYRLNKVDIGYTGDPFRDMQYLFGAKEDPVIFDVGAHYGVVSQEFRKMFPGSVIYAFEPFPESFARLVENTKQDAEIHALNFGLADHAGSRLFCSNTSPATNSLLQSDTRGVSTWGSSLLETNNTIEASFDTIDSFLSRYQIPGIDILKLDVQGAESLVMQGAAEACSRGLISLVYSEIITQPTYSGQQRLDEALSVFYECGFDLYNIYNFSRTSCGRMRQIDAIFTRLQDV